MADYDNEPKLDFAVFTNKYAKTDRHPSEVGKIEFTREFLKAMVDRAKTGTMPVLRAAMWNRTSKAGLDYKFFRLELERVKSMEEPTNGGVPENKEANRSSPEEKDDNEGLPW
tara:strand:+ start:932 stop:1270 length:339 start_codon:yes stop_codon:yes gene_type:complete